MLMVTVALDDFYPRSPCGERREKPRQTRTDTNFYPRSPCGERPLLALLICPLPDFYPRSPCGERRVTVLGIQHKVGISIHALLAESDMRAENHANSQQEFLSTLSLRRATGGGHISKARTENFYPRSPCGERPIINCNCNFTQKFLSTLSLRRATARRESRQQPAGISIHALLAESDTNRRPIFLCRTISIHALLAESDESIGTLRTVKVNFYPRSPCGERRDVIAEMTEAQSISIHALLAESDLRLMFCPFRLC